MMTATARSLRLAGSSPQLPSGSALFSPPLHARLLLSRGLLLLVHDMASLYTIDQPESLRSLLVENGIDAKIVEYMTNEMKFLTVRQFARAFDKDNFSEGVIEAILDNVPDCKSDMLQASRLRVAWESARAMLDGALKRKDLGLPVADFRVEELHSNFMRAYGFFLDPGMLPDALFLEQVASQMKSGRVSLHDLRTMLPPILPGGNLEAKKRKTIGDRSDIVVVDVEPRLRKINTPAKAIEALAVLLNGYALCGLFPFPLRGQPRVAHFGDLQIYFNFVISRVARFPGRSSKAAEWFVDADKRSRKLAGDAFEERSTPFGQTLRRIATEAENSPMWTLPKAMTQRRHRANSSGCEQSRHPSGEVVLTPASSCTDRPEKQQSSESSAGASLLPTPRGATQETPDPKKAPLHPDVNPVYTYDQLCTAFNNRGGCVLKQKDCPSLKYHRCNFRHQDGSMCGRWQHNWLGCPFNCAVDKDKHKKNKKSGGTSSHDHSY